MVGDGACHLPSEEAFMTAGGDFYTRIAHPTEIIELLETMSQPGSASLVPEQDQAAQLPVVVATASGDALHLDISAIRDAAPALSEGMGFRLTGQGPEGVVRSPVLTV